ncbi:MAG TPA: ATP-binding protein [Terracidiphilus sp.]|jgi:signal transduction histidine kinase|nr:ATP-binding protein [Terracidiphilus sp.]
MNQAGKPVEVETVALRDVAEALRVTRPFAETRVEDLGGVDSIERIRIPAGATLAEPGDPIDSYWIVIEGEMHADRPEPSGPRTLAGIALAGEGFGEASLVLGKSKSSFFVYAVENSVLLRFTADQFWSMLACCPALRAVVLKDSSKWIQAHQMDALHREKLVSLGTLAAGLMHELHNPGAAAKRAASQLRENLMRLQEVSLRNGSQLKTPEQLECMKGLLDHSLNGGCRLTAMSSIEQADAEEEMGEWLSGSGVENAYQIAPVLVGMSFEREELECARLLFSPAAFSDALNWLGSLVSSVSLVCAIEESISRISDLVMAVKKFAYDEKSPAKDLDVHDSLQSTLTILGHKLRIKEIRVEKKFAASPSIIHTKGSALSQVWTNLIDNAADASPAGGSIEISSWTEPDQGWLVVCIRDRGEGISDEVRPRIFEPFFTTKPQGSGTGLGLEIVHRIVTQKFGGKIEVLSEPGDTRFIVRLPLSTVDDAAKNPS